MPTRLPAFVLGFLAAMTAWPQGADTVFYPSPSQKFSVAFIPLPRPKPQDSSGVGESHFVKYELLFRGKGGKTAARAIFTDVYGVSAGDKPTPHQDLTARLTWSPREDFVILPEENWERPPGPPKRQAVNLRPDFRWKASELRFESLEWITRYKIAGEFKEECERSVVAFDGRKGKTVKIREGRDSAAFVMRLFKKPHLFLESQLGECPDSSAQKNFREGCVRYNVLNGRFAKVPCPKR